MTTVNGAPTKSPRKWLTRLKWLTVAYLAFWLVVSCGHVADRLILMPPQGPVDPKGAQRETITLHGDTVEMWKARSPGAASREPVAFIMYFVGNADRADRWATFNAAQWDSKPVEVIGVNYPGYGGSTGPARLARIGPAVLAAFDAVKARAGSRPIFLQANSLGTTAALCILARREVAGATIQNPPALRQLILQHHGWWNLWLLAVPASFDIPSDLDSVTNASHAKAPAVFVLSQHDEVVPVNFQRMVFNAYQGEKRLIDLPNATHNTGMDQAAWDEFGRQLDWLWQKAGLAL